MFRLASDVQRIDAATSSPYSSGSPRGPMTLREALARTGPLPQAWAIEIARQLALELAERHAEGAVHGAITPDAVVVSAAGERWSARLLDGGAADGGPPSSDPRWSSPEQIAGERPSVESDVYALGVLLFHMLTGQPPFQGTPADVARMALYEPPPSVAGLSPHWVHPVLDVLVAECLCKMPGLRQTSASELAMLLAAVPAPAPRARRGSYGTGGARAAAWGRARLSRAAPASIQLSEMWPSRDAHDRAA